MGLREITLDNLKPFFNAQIIMASLDFEKYVFSYDKLIAPDIPSFTFPADEIIAVIGHTGAEKSTFSKYL